MKRFICAAYLACVLAASGSGVAEEAPYVEIFSISGKAEVRIAPSDEWVEAKVDAELHSGDSIKTHEDSSVELAFDEDKVVRVNQTTYVTVLLKEGEKLELIDGEVYSTIKNLPQGSSFEIRTPSGIAGARGTDWLTRVENETMSVEAYDESPFVRGVEEDGRPSREETVLQAGFKTTVRKFQKPPMPERLSQREIDRWRAWKSELEPRVKEAIQKRERLGKRLGGDKGVMGRGPGRPLSGRSDLGRDGEFRPKKQKMDRPNRMNKMDRDTVEPQKNRVNGEAKKGFPRGGLKRAGPQGR